MTIHVEPIPAHSCSKDCSITPVGKRRDGGTRYWCLTHKADATAKYGLPMSHCRTAHISPVSPEEIVFLNLDDYPGGVALWGAVPPVYDTTRLPIERGIHAHARKISGGSKDIDSTVRAVQLYGNGLPENGLLFTELDAIYYMVSKLFGFEMRHVVCPYCDHSHLDKDWFSVHKHRRHLCAGCGKYFNDTVPGIGNPICNVQNKYNFSPMEPKKSERSLDILQSEYPGGIRIWGSNPAFLWSSENAEEEGIHIHVYGNDGETVLYDNTYSEVTIDRVNLDAMMVRILMAQSALPHIEKRVVSLVCERCFMSEFNIGEGAYTPKSGQTCSKCGGKFLRSGRLRKVISNPLVKVLEDLALNAPRTPQRHSSGLMVEAPSNIL